jgi:hypothetical protein
MIKKTKVALV